MTLKHKNILEVIQNKNISGISVYSNKGTHYSELQLFRDQINTDTLGPNNKPYTAQKRSILTYQGIFFAVGTLYLTLGILIYLKTFTWTYSFLFGNFSIALKSLVCALCTGAAITTLSLGFAMRTEKEVSKTLYRKAKLRLKRIYQRKMAKFGLNRYLAVGNERERVHSFRQTYLDALEKLHDQKDEAAHLLERISHSKSIDGEQKERLFNQALLEMSDRMMFVVDTFKSTNHKKLLAPAS